MVHSSTPSVVRRSRVRLSTIELFSWGLGRAHVEALEGRRLLAAWGLTPVVEYDVPELAAQPAYYDYSFKNGTYYWHCTLEDGSIVNGTTFETVLDENVPGERITRDAFLNRFAARLRDEQVAAGEPSYIEVEPTSFDVSLGEADARTYVNFSLVDPMVEQPTTPIEAGFLMYAGRSYNLIKNTADEITEAYRDEVWGIGYACILLAPFGYSTGVHETLAQVNRTLATGESVIVAWDDGVYSVVQEVDENAPAGTIFTRITRLQQGDDELATLGIKWPLPSWHTEPATVRPDEPVEPGAQVAASADGDSFETASPVFTAEPTPFPSRAAVGTLLLTKRDNLLGSASDDLLE